MTRAIALCFGCVFAVLVMYPFPLGYLPGTVGLAALAHEPVRWGVNVLAALLGLGEPSTLPTGSGDTLFAYLELLLFAIVAAIAAIAWTLVARKRDVSPRFTGGLRIALRYWLAVLMCLYGLVKLFEIQFRAPGAWILDQRVGDKSPMGLLWTFMGFSRPYTMVAGLAEVIAGVLLVWRRTATLGALVAVAVMANIVAMNFCYDVPVKLFSLELLAAALAIAAPDVRRVIAAALGHATTDVALPPRTILEPTRQIAKLAFAICFAAMVVQFATFTPHASSELDGGWDVVQFSRDGVDHPPLATDGDRWARVLIADRVVALRSMTETRRYFRARIDPRGRTLRLASPFVTGVLTYERPDPDHLIVDGTIGTVRYHVTLARMPEWLLASRGFHWIQEAPFNR